MEAWGRIERERAQGDILFRSPGTVSSGESKLATSFLCDRLRTDGSNLEPGAGADELPTVPANTASRQSVPRHRLILWVIQLAHLGVWHRLQNSTIRAIPGWSHSHCQASSASVSGFRRHGVF